MSDKGQLAREWQVVVTSTGAQVSAELPSAFPISEKNKEEREKMSQENEKKMSTDRLAHALLTIYEDFVEAGEVKTLSLEEYEADQMAGRQRSDRLKAEFEARFKPSNL